ncbi:MAG: GNAT family N-acetyltransferase [Candidatus Melainabacteria bacterium HGW-Melainabacteria-1]|nr:MAG: GNAT family N-acetyltransferase [Candidatus Melainabacteria bacterium HGW-Melainabacteria-1]
MIWIFEPLDSQHDRQGFTTSQTSLELFIKQQARQEMSKGVSVTYVMRQKESMLIIGYYSLSAHSVRASDLPEALSRKLPRYPQIPALLLGRLAIDSRFQGQGLGSMLLYNALETALQTSHLIGAVAVVVDALDEAAASFYAKYDFRRFEGTPNRLYVLMKTIDGMVN